MSMISGGGGSFVLPANAFITNPAANQTVQGTVDSTIIFKQYNGTNTLNIFEVQLKDASKVFYIDKDGNAFFGASGGGSTQWTTGAMAVGAAGSVKVGAHTGNILVVSKDGGAVTEIMDKAIKFTKSFTILTPTAADTNLVQMAFAQAITIVRVYCSTDTGTATMNADERAEATPNTAGTNVLSADIVCDNGTRTSCASGCDVNTISNGTIAANAPLNFQVTSVASAPGVVRFHIDYTID